MTKATTKRPSSPKRDTKPADDSRSWVGHVVTLVVAVVSLFGGVSLQDKYDVLKTNRTLAITYSEAADTSAKAVEEVVQSLFRDLGNPSVPLSEARVAELRDALLDLRRDAERLTIQVGSNETQFQDYVRALADLANAAESVTGSADADPLIDALNDFYVTKRNFELDIASKHRPSST